MAETNGETTVKRPREEEEGGLEQEGDAKRHHRSAYHNILAHLLLEEAPDDGGAAEETDGLSSLISTFQQEISSASESDPVQTESGTESGNPDPIHRRVEDGEVLRHLLEASDDELGIPSREEGEVVVVAAEHKEEGAGLWEMEDEAANFYAQIHSELFM